MSLECSLLDDAIKTNVLEIAEILTEFLSRLRTKIPGHCHLFRKSKKILATTNKLIQETYARSRPFLFPEADDTKSNGKVKDSYFHTIADRLQTIGDPILKFRDKVLAHKYDEDRFITQLSFEQYCEIREAFKNTLNDIAIVGTLSSNDWCMTRSPIEIERTIKWLTDGLMAAAPPIRRNMSMEPVQKS